MLALDSPRLIVLRTFAFDYHSGQWSRLYRLGCRADSLLRSRGHHARTPQYADHIAEAARKSDLYASLVQKYGQE
jgi:hypothetical protein